MKLFILTAALSLGLHAIAADVDPVNVKALKTFNQVFVNAKNVQWSNTANFSEASFNTDNMKTRVAFNNDGNLVRTIRYYKEGQLPTNVLISVKKQFDNKEIFGVTEISNAEAIYYNIILKDSKHLYNITTDHSGDVIKSTKYKRGDI